MTAVHYLFFSSSLFSPLFSLLSSLLSLLWGGRLAYVGGRRRAEDLGGIGSGNKGLFCPAGKGAWWWWS